jgi:hypothetical protein
MMRNSETHKNKKRMFNFIFTLFTLFIMPQTSFSNENISHLNSAIKLTTPEIIGTENGDIIGLSKVEIEG